MMKHVRFRIASMAVVAAAVGLATVAKGGDLDPPPGPIQATNRVQINQQYGGPPIEITEPGSYVLTSNIVALDGHPRNGIEIDADNVTVDLNGFVVDLTPEHGYGIIVIGAHHNITIHNGTIRVTSLSPGIDASEVTNCRIENVDVYIAFTGISAGTNSTVSNCTVRGTYRGISAGSNSTVSSCSVYSSDFGIEVNNGLVTDCVVFYCSGYNAGGIWANHSIVRNCSVGWVCSAAQPNASIVASGGCYVIGNRISEFTLVPGEGAPGILVIDSGNRIEGNNIWGAPEGGGTGIVVEGTGNLIIKNSLHGVATPYDIAPGNACGTFIDVAGECPFLSNEPWANFVY